MLGRLFGKKSAAQAFASPPEAVLAAIQSPAGMLFLVSGPEDGSCVCNDWVGAVLRVDERDATHPSLADAIEDGLFHPGCRHSLYAVRNEDGSADAQFRTKLAIDAMRKRIESDPQDGEARFTRLYGWARRVDRAGGPMVAVILCEAALELLSAQNIFGSSQADLERILKSRIATIRVRAERR